MSDHPTESPRPGNTPSDKLATLLGFDPRRPAKVTSKLFAEVVEKITAKHTEEAKLKAEELLGKAIALSQQATTAERKFQSEMKKFTKELGKIVNTVQGILDGRAPVDPNEENSSERAEE